MPEIHEVATLTSKGQMTLPKSIRQALGVDTGGKVAFDLRDGEVVVTRAVAEHEDPAIAAFLERQAAARSATAPVDAGLADGAGASDRAAGGQGQLANAGLEVSLDEDIGGEVAI